MTETLLVERYRVVEKTASRLGGEAFLAEDTGAGGAMVELHVLPSSPQAEEAFPPVRQAIEALKLVPAGPLARALDLSWGPDGELVLVQEYQEGRALADLMAAEPLAPLRAREVLRGVLHALAVARRQGLHHGGLSPWRVLVDPSADDRVVVLDLGVLPLATPPAADSPLAGEAVYRAPGDARGPRADAYAIAVIALELLTGVRAQVGRASSGAEPSEAATAAVGADFVKAVQSLARADGSARAYDAGTLLGLLPARQRRARRSRFTLRETWDGDIGSGTARLLQLGLLPEYQNRMPAEITGTGPASPGNDAPSPIFMTDSVAPRPRVQLETPPKPKPPIEVKVEPRVETKLEPRPEPKVEPHVTERTPIEVRIPDSSPFKLGSMPTLAPPPPPPPPPQPIKRPTHDPFAGIESALDQAGGAVTMQLPTPSRHPEPFVLRAQGGKVAYFLVAPKDGALDLGRERGNDIILRAFKGAVIENVDSNRISRKHLYVQYAPDELLVACGQREGNKASVYGSSLDGVRLPVEKRGNASIGLTAPLPTGRSFELALALTTVKLEGRVMPGSLALRLVRKDGAGHQYVVLWGAEATLGSGEDDVLRLPPESGVVAGHARLALDTVRGSFQVSPLKGPLRSGGKDVPKGTWVPVSERLQVGNVTLAGRPSGDQDYLVVGAEIALPV